MDRKEMDEAGFNWFERLMENLLEGLSNMKRARRRGRVKESVDEAEAKRRKFEEMMRRGEAQVVNVMENTVEGQRVTNLEANIAWFNDLWELYRKSDFATHHFEIVGEYNSLGLPNGKVTIYRINGPRMLQKMRAKQGG